MIEPGPYCITCGYSLANIAREGVCPECATPVARSLSVNHLRDSSVEYLRTVRRGVYLQIGAIVAVIVASGLTMVPTNVAAQRASAIVALACSLVGVLGAWFISSTDPAREGDVPFNRLLARCRMWAIIDALSQTAGTLFGMLLSGQLKETLDEACRLPAYGTLIYGALIIANLGARAENVKLHAVATKLSKLNYPMLGASVLMLGLVALPKNVAQVVSAIIGLVMLVIGILFLVRYIQSIVGIARTVRDALAHAIARESSGA